MASLKELFAQAEQARREAAVIRAETSRLSHESAAVSRRLRDQQRSCSAALDRVKEKEQDFPTWPAWGWPDDDLRHTLVPVD